MTQFQTPKGTIKMTIDGQFVDFEAVPVTGCSVDGCYKIPVEFEPDGHDHQIACCFFPDLWVQGYGSSGERYMVTAFHDRTKDSVVTIGLVCNDEYYYDDEGDLQCAYESYDFDTDYFVNVKENMCVSTYEIKPFTKTSRFVFGITWVSKNAANWMTEGEAEAVIE